MTKYEHAHMVFELNGHRVVIDPGSFSPLREAPAHVEALIVTHEHADHWTIEQASALRERNPGMRIFTTAATAQMLHEHDELMFDSNTTVVREGDEVTVGPFELSFHGSRHAVLHSSIPVVENIGVCINELVFFGGDSLEPPAQVKCEFLALPIGSPWSNVGEVLDYIDAIRPSHAFAVHEMMLSEHGLAFYERFVTGMLDRTGGTLVRVPFGQPFSLESASA